MSNLSRAYHNFIWRLEGITPTNSTSGLRFRNFDPLKRSPKRSTGDVRKFSVAWLGSRADGEDESPDANDMYSRTARHNFEISVEYPAVYPWDTMQQLVADDRHDILRALRDQANNIGYSASNATTDIGLWERRRTSDSLQTDDDVWILKLDYTAIINEPET
jgi:hypothetical protein